MTHPCHPCRWVRPPGARDYFGEGLAYYHDRLYQLTYQAHLVIVYNFTTFVNTGELDVIANHPYGGEGWGLSTLHNELVMSNGDDHIVFRNPYTFAETRRITVHQGAHTVSNINELEVVGDKICKRDHGPWRAEGGGRGLGERERGRARAILPHHLAVARLLNSARTPLPGLILLAPVVRTVRT